MIRQLLLVVAGVLALTLTASAQEVDPRVQRIASKLRCPVCQNESVADSPSELSAQMRTLIRDRLAAGETEEQILHYFVSRYGEWILLDPPRQGVLWLAWLAPTAALLGGAALVIAYLRRTVRPRAR